MTDIFRSLVMAFLMFSIIPMPPIQWEKKNMRYMLAWLPLVGVAAGLVQWLWLLLCNVLSLGNLLFAAGLTLLPVLLTGGIHMDGFCDTADALASHLEPERKREILKDPNVGAFAVIYAAAYFILFFALCTELPRTQIAVLTVAVHQVFARTLGGICSAAFPSASENGLQHTFRDAASGTVTLLLALWAVLCSAVLCIFSLASGIVCIAVFLLCLIYLFRMSKREFGGMSGDLAGYMITLSELLMLLSYIMTEKVVAL